MKNFLRAGMIGLWATSATAHSVLDGTIPANNAIVVAVPSEVLLDFKGDIRLTRVAMSHAGTDSVDIDLGDQTSFMKEFTLPLPDMGNGEYLFEWRGLGTDGHVMNGTFGFIVDY